MPILTSRLDKDRAGVIWGSGIGGLETFKLKFLILLPEMEHHVSIRFYPKMILDIAGVTFQLNMVLEDLILQLFLLVHLLQCYD
jgi:hypothetical protein